MHKLVWYHFGTGRIAIVPTLLPTRTQEIFGEHCERTSAKLREFGERSDRGGTMVRSYSPGACSQARFGGL